MDGKYRNILQYPYSTGLFSATVEIIYTYGAETWTTSKSMIKRIDIATPDFSECL